MPACGSAPQYAHLLRAEAQARRPLELYSFKHPTRQNSCRLVFAVPRLHPLVVTVGAGRRCVNVFEETTKKFANSLERHSFAE